MMEPNTLEMRLSRGELDATLKTLYGAGGMQAARERCAQVLERFRQTFDCPAEALFSAPGRTELGGNHTDHQHGRVLAAAVDLDILAAAAPNQSGMIRVQSQGYPLIVVDLKERDPRPEERNTSAALIRGVAARLAELGRVPYSAKKFFVKHQDRILFGTDCTPLSMGYHKIYYRFFETKDEYFPYQPEGELPGQGRWAIYGIGLEDEILKKIYYKNACKVLSLDENRFVGGVR